MTIFEGSKVDPAALRDGLGGAPVPRELRVIFMDDNSGSMDRDGKIQALNVAKGNMYPELKKVASANGEVRVWIKEIVFNDHAQWITPNWVPLEQYTWTDLTAGGGTAMGEAMGMVGQELSLLPANEKGCQPVIIMTSDGGPTDNFNAGMQQLLSVPWGAKALRLAVGIGKDACYPVLEQFINNPKFKPFAANNPESLMRQISFASTLAFRLSAAPHSKPAAGNASAVVSIVSVGGPNGRTSGAIVW